MESAIKTITSRRSAGSSSVSGPAKVGQDVTIRALLEKACVKFQSRVDAGYIKCAPPVISH